ncbi:MAG: hypothetical protein RLO50_16625 [Azospirillaceae bacterium]
MILPTVKLVDWLLSKVKAILSDAVIRKLDAVLLLVGGFGAYVLIALAAVTTLVIGIRMGSATLIIGAIVAVPVGLVLQYLSTKMLGSVDRLLNSTRTEMTSAGFLEVVAVVLIVLAIVAPILGVVDAIENTSLIPLATGAAVAVLALYGAAVALNPVLVNVHISGAATIGLEAVGIVTFLLKTFYRFTPVAFGVFVVYISILLLELLIISFGSGFAGAGLVLTGVLWNAALALLWPFVAYIVFVCVYLAVDLVRSIVLVGRVADQYRRPEDAKAIPPETSADIKG